MTRIEDEIRQNRRRSGKAFAADRQPSADQETSLATGTVPLAVEVRVEVDTRPVNDTLLVGHPDAGNGWGQGRAGDHRGAWTTEVTTLTTLTRGGERMLAEALGDDGTDVSTTSVGDQDVTAFAFEP